MKWKWLEMLAGILLVVGGLNWGLALFNVNLVTAIFGAGWFTKVIYGAVGLSAIYMAWMYFDKK
jgi:uncharacterized membrane protein YuzA (DUF378 family)